MRVPILVSTVLTIAATSLNAQVATPPSDTARRLAPATKLEAFQPTAGSVTTMGYTELGSAGGVSVDVREMREGDKAPVRGLVVEVVESQYRTERSFIDADEIPELIKGIDAILAVRANPTSFTQFEAKYRTRGDLVITAYNATVIGSAPGAIRFSVRAGRTLTASTGVSEANMIKLKSFFEAGLAKLNGGRE